MQAPCLYVSAVKLNAYEQAFDLQEEERERRMDYVPEESAVNTETIEVRAPLDIYCDWFSFCFTQAMKY